MVYSRAHSWMKSQALGKKHDWDEAHDHLAGEAGRQARDLKSAHELARNQRRNAEAAAGAAREALEGLKRARRLSEAEERTIDEITGRRAGGEVASVPPAPDATPRDPTLTLSHITCEIDSSCDLYTSLHAK